MFNNNVNLQCHVKICAGDGRFKCEKCLKVTGNKVQLKYHKRECRSDASQILSDVIGPIVQEVLTEKVQCSKYSIKVQQKEMDRHMRLAHPQAPKQFKCGNCTFSCFEENLLKEHNCL